MARGMHKGPRSTRQWGNSDQKPERPSSLSRRQKDFTEKQERLSNQGAGLLYHRPGSNKK